MKSALYTGWIQHRRFGPVRNTFRYRIFMSFIDLAELPALFDRRWFWSARRAALAWFRREDFLGPVEVPLDEAVRELVFEQTRVRPKGRICLLTHLRYFGYSFNPVSFYYVYDETDSHVETIVAQITNTPWKERHAYVLPVADGTATNARSWRFSFGKQFHVSPFMPMDMRYEWRFGPPSEGLHVHMENWREAQLQFDATLNLKREEMTAGSMARALINFPLVTLKVSALIYWQAMKLLWKRAPFHAHPDKRNRQVTDS